MVRNDAYSAYVLAYDAARIACIALLAQQGLRATTSGGHYAVERTVRATWPSSPGAGVPGSATFDQAMARLHNDVVDLVPDS